MINHERLVRLANRAKRGKMHLATAFDVTPDLVDAVEATAEQAQKPVYQIRPYEEDGGVREAVPLLNDLHEFKRGKWMRDATPTSAWEFWYDDGALTFNMVPGTPALASRVRDQLHEDYPNSELRPRRRDIPELEPGHSFAGASMSLLRGSHLPIRHLDIDGFGSDGSSVRDPYKNVLTRITGEDDATVMVQFTFRPRRMRTVYQKRALRAANSLESSTTEWDWARFKKVVREPDETDLSAASIIRGEGHNQGERRLYEISARILVSAPDEATTLDRLREVVRAMGTYYEGHTKQGFYGEPVFRYRPFLADLAERSVPGGVGKDLVEARALAGAVHLPDADVNNSAIDRSQTKAGNPVPPRTPRFDFEAVGVDEPELLTPRERFRLMVRHGPDCPGDSDDAIWVGEGARDGTEAGIPMEDLLHLAFNGKTGHGKSKEALAVFYQLIERGVGALWTDPKDGEDAKIAAALAIAAGRGDDIVPIRVGADGDYQVSFNFLEAPTDAEPGTAAYLDAIEPMADVIEDVLAQAGGTTRESWGERMSGLTRHIVRGVSQLDLGQPATLMTLNYAGATATDRDKYAEYVHDQSIPFIEDTADGMFAEYSDDEVEPWARRLNQVVESAPLRDIACNPDGVSLTEIIREGKIPILFGETASDTALQMLMTALVPSLWTVKQELNHSDAPEDQDIPPFHMFIDELNDIVTPRMGLPQVLSNARSYDMHVHGIFQDPTNQTSDVVTGAFEGQADTLSVYPGTKDFARSVAAHHSEDVGKQELLDLPHYRQYMRIRDDTGDRTWSYPVDLGYPIHEADDEIPTKEEALDHVKELEKELGNARRSAAEIKADDPFASTGDVTEDEGGDDLEVTDAVERAAAQGVYDTAIRTDQGVVSREECAPAVRRRVARLDETPRDTTDRLATPDDVYRHVLQHVHDDVLEETDAGFRAVSPRSTFATVGTDQSAGGKDHIDLAWRDYRPLTWAGLDLYIHDASGDDPDCLARPAPEAERNASGLVERLLDGRPEARVELECSTARSKPGVTGQHVMQAAQEGRSCIVLVDPNDLNDVVDTLRRQPRFCRSGHDVDGETRYYTSPRKVTIDGETMTRPGGRNNVWVRDDESGELSLRCSDGIEHARFDSVHEFDADADAYPVPDGRNVYAPIVPDVLLDGVNTEPTEEIVTAPEGADDLSDLELVVADDELRVPADAVDAEPDQDDDADGALVNDEWEDSPALVKPENVDVHDRARDLLRLIQREADGPVTAGEVIDLADAHDGDLDVDAADRTVRDWLSRLVEANAMRSGEYRANEGREYHVVRSVDEVASQ